MAVKSDSPAAPLVYAEGEGRLQLRISAIVPCHTNAGHREQGLPAIRRPMPHAGGNVVADGAEDDLRQVRAVARHGAAARTGDAVPVFVDANVVVAPVADVSRR
jgi:hypothetical protein